MVVVALAVGTPPGTGTRRTLAGVGKASEIEFHGAGKEWSSGLGEGSF